MKDNEPDPEINSKTLNILLSAIDFSNEVKNRGHGRNYKSTSPISILKTLCNAADVVDVVSMTSAVLYSVLNLSKKLLQEIEDTFGYETWKVLDELRRIHKDISCENINLEMRFESLSDRAYQVFLANQICDADYFFTPEARSHWSNSERLEKINSYIPLLVNMRGREDELTSQYMEVVMGQRQKIFRETIRRNKNRKQPVK